MTGVVSEGFFVDGWHLVGGQAFGEGRAVPSGRTSLPTTIDGSILPRASLYSHLKSRAILRNRSNSFAATRLVAVRRLLLHIVPDQSNIVLVFDFGGGTCDLVALKVWFDATKPGGLRVEPQSISPYQQLGGDTIDRAIMEEVVWPQVCQQNGIERERLTATERKQVEDSLRYNVCRKLKTQVNEDLKRLADEHPERFHQDD
jgi:hypothetical protein